MGNKGSKFRNGVEKNIENDISSLITSDGFAKLSDNLQELAIINTATIKQTQTESGFMGKLLGTKMPNMAIYSTFLFCCILLTLVGIDLFLSYDRCESLNLELIKIIIPVITMSLGYMFGKSNNDHNKEGGN